MEPKLGTHDVTLTWRAAAEVTGDDAEVTKKEVWRFLENHIYRGEFKNNDTHCLDFRFMRNDVIDVFLHEGKRECHIELDATIHVEDSNEDSAKQSAKAQWDVCVDDVKAAIGSHPDIVACYDERDNLGIVNIQATRLNS